MEQRYRAVLAVVQDALGRFDSFRGTDQYRPRPGARDSHYTWTGQPVMGETVLKLERTQALRVLGWSRGLRGDPVDDDPLTECSSQSPSR